MLVLALDTCLDACSVALGAAAPVQSASGLAADPVLAARAERMRAGHAERLMPMIAEVMAEAGATFAQVGLIAVTLGPGTFTGVRIGLAAARGLSLATGAPIAACSSLHALALAASEVLSRDRTPGAWSGERGEPPAGDAAADLIAAIPARDGQLQVQLIDPSSPASPATEPRLLSPSAALALTRGRRTIAVGRGAPELAAAALARGLTLTAALADLQPDARAILAIAAELPVIAHPAPIYLQAPDAKVAVGQSLPRAASDAGDPR